ncbi:DUF1796 family putative cysteine peptidase [Enterobacter sp. ESY66]|uniref:DUF1796 family putative cysteine peptidase n=1 Tax=Enterobacter TaxID=547 RepID=UPI0015B5E943|nr:DUF1796 family putative cysteine peptidase [Enterobacter sp. SECR18-0236]MBH0124179.1 hypothetical protein [Enterobacter sp. SECR18-0236]
MFMTKKRKTIIFTDIINGLYTEILGRSADADGILFHIENFIQYGIEEGTKITTKTLISSEEFSAKINFKTKPVFPLGTQTINGKEVEHIVSLGNHCLTATLLKKYGLKKYSYPFDWIFSSPEMVIDCIEDGFSTLLNKKYHSSITSCRKNNDFEPGSSHSLYEEKYNIKELFTHRDITKADDYNYFKRSAERFNSVLKSKGGKIFVMVSRREHNLEKHFYDIVDCLNKKTKDFVLIAISLSGHDEENKYYSSKIEKEVDGSIFCKITPSVDEIPTGRFDNIPDDMAIISLVSKYKLNLSA